MYSSEKDFRKYVTNEKVICKDYTTYYPIYVGIEVNMGRYIPDIVMVLFKNIPAREIIPQRWTLKHSFVLHYIRTKGPLSLKRVADLCYSDEESTEKILKSMKSSGMIRKTSEGYYGEEELSTWESEIVGVELKMERWSRAVRQAERYKEFADSAHVVMPNEGAHNALDNLVKFQEKGVGLSVVHDGSERTVLPAVAESPNDPRHQHLEVSALMGHTPNWLRYESNASSHA